MTVSKVHASMEIWGWPPRLGDRKPGIHQFHEGERTAQCPMVFKAAILLLYARIFSIEERVSKSIRILIWLLLITLLPVQSLKLAVCKPIPAYWELSNSLEEQARYCRQDQQSVFKADITIAIITDLLILIIPVPLTIPLSFPIRKKDPDLAVFALRQQRSLRGDIQRNINISPRWKRRDLQHCDSFHFDVSFAWDVRT